MADDADVGPETGFRQDAAGVDRPAELHIVARCGHGYGMVRRGLSGDRMIDLFEDRLADRGLK